MPPDGAVILADVRARTLSIVCERCRRYGRYDVPQLLLCRGPTRSRSCLSFWIRWPTARRRARSASSTDVRRALTRGFAGKSEDHIAVALIGLAGPYKPSSTGSAAAPRSASSARSANYAASRRSFPLSGSWL